MPGEPGGAGALDPENVEVVDYWKLYRGLGAWAVEQIDLEMSPAEAEEFIWLVYQLEVENNRLREQYSDHQKGTYLRMAWDMR